MKKLKVLIETALIIAFIAMMLGFILIMIGALKNNYTIVIVGFFSVLIATVIYSILIIYGLFYYFKNRR